MPADPATGRGVGVELYLGHYGPGAAGVLRYFETDEFLVPLDAAAPVGECACAYLERARWERDASTLVFEVEGCLPRHADDGALRVRGRLESIDGELVGHWSIDTEAPDGSVVSHLVPLTFSEHRGLGDATDEELRCASADDGDAVDAVDADGTP